MNRRFFLNPFRCVLALLKHRFFLNTLKYALAGGLLAFVIWTNWGYNRKTAARIELEGAAAPNGPEKAQAAPPTVTGRVTAYEPGNLLTIATPARDGQPGETLEFGLVKNNRFFGLAGKKTKFEPGDAAEAIQSGATVAVWEVSPGLAYVWKRHVVEGEPIHCQYLALAFLCFTAAVAITFLRWYVLVRAVELPFTVTNAFRLGFVGLFFSAFLPGSVGGDIVKAAFIAREQNRRTVAVATVVIDRALALWALIWFVALVGAGFWFTDQLTGKAETELKSIVLGAAGIVGATALVWVLLGLLPNHRAERFAGRLSRLRKVGPSAAEFWRAIWMYRCRQKSVALAMLIALVGHVGFVLAFYFSALVLAEPGQDIPSWQTHFLIVPIGMVIGAMPLFPGGAGIGELGFGGLYALVGCTAASGVLGSLVQRVVVWVVALLGGLVYLRLKASATPAPPVEQLAAVEA